MLTADREKAIVEKCRTDPAHFETLYDEYYSPIFGYILRRVGKYDDARDLTSETFLKAYSSIGKFRWKGVSVSSWLYRIATNEVNTFYRKQSRLGLSFFDIRESFFASYADPASLEAEKEAEERQLAENQMFLRVMRIVQGMPPRSQAVVALRFFEQKSIREIAEIVSIKEGTVKSLISRGLERIRDALRAAPPFKELDPR